MVKHRFFCVCCGKEGIPVYRKNSRLRKTFHRKKLYCIHCKKEINHIECKNEEEIKMFKEMYKRGDFIKETEIYD